MLYSTGRLPHFLVPSSPASNAVETADIGCILDLGELCQPVNDQKIGIKDLGVILREVGRLVVAPLACRNPAPSHRQES